MFQVMKLLLVGFLVVLVALPIIHANIDTISCTAEDGTTKIIPISKVNDNYCDCPVNGEDEPDTSACAHTVQQFICNGDVDHKTIPLSFVTDGVCDCCDGTDEVAGACKNTCEEERINKIKKTQAEIDLHLKGETFKKKYIKQGKEGVKKLDASVKQLKKETKLEEEELQSKIYGSPPTNQQVLQKMYSALMQKKQQLSVIEKLSDSPLVFGGLREYYPLLGKCFKHKSNEKQFKGGSFEHVAKDFIFEVCPFSSIVQHDVDEPEKKPTLLGFFQNWDEEVDNIMIFSGGDECWNGPNRVVRMEVVCGSEDALVDVKENGKCTYEFVFKTPAACNKKHADKLKKYIKKISPPEPEIVHDEL